MSTTTFTGTVNATARMNAPTFGTTSGNMALAPAGSGVAVASGKTFSADVIGTTTAATDLTLNPTGPNIDCSNKTLINIAGIVSPVIQAVAAGPIATANATPATLLTLPISANSCYIVTSDVSAVSPTGGTAADGAAWHDVLRVTNRAGTLSVDSMQSSASLDAGLAAASVAYSASGASLVATVTGVASLGVRWTARASYVSAST